MQVTLNNEQARALCDWLQASVGPVTLTQQGDGSIIFADECATIEITKAGTEFACES